MSSAGRLSGTGEPFSGPVVEYRKISATKYRVRLHGVREGFPLIFNETFDHGWKAYLVPWRGGNPGQDGSQLLEAGWVDRTYGKTAIDRHWASPGEVREYLKQGWLTDLADTGIATGRGITEARRETNFIAAKQANTIQNDNLRPGPRWEVWLAGEVFLPCKGKDICNPLEWENWNIEKNWNGDAIEWPSLFHWQANGYANSWWIEPKLIKNLAADRDVTFYRDNDTGSMDVEIVLEYAVQRWFDVGLLISLLAFLFVAMTILHACWRWFFPKAKG